MVKRYRKKPVEIEALEWTGTNISEMCKFTGRDVGHLLANGELYIETLDGTHHASVWDYIIKGIHGEFYPCKPDIFAKTYEDAALRAQQERGWISVKERLPEPEKTVLIYCRSQSSQWKYVYCGFYVPEGTYREDSGYTWDFECCDKYDEEKGDYQVRSGWYEAIHNWDDYSAVGVSDIVTHWMPLPEPPKEEV